MANVCLGNLLPSSVLAYDNIDLIPNGYIPQVGTTSRPRTSNQDGQIISSRETIRLLPADRIYAEFWYGVSTRITGTNLGDLGQGVFGLLGFLGGGAGAVIGGALACSLVGDSERAISRWVFHVCDAETKLNREIVLTQENISTGIISLPDYAIAVLGVTRKPIAFVSPDTPLTPEQIAIAKSTTADRVESLLGRRVAPDQMTDSDMRILLGITDLNEIETIGNSRGNVRGWPQDSTGQIRGEFKNYKYSDKENLFIEIIRDERKNRYRADNEYDRSNGHCFWNGSTDDITDKNIRFRLQEVFPEGETSDTTPLKAGDKIYISYSSGLSPIFRHATENITNFFLFPDQSAYQLPPLDLVKGWNFKKFKFRVRKNPTERCVLADIKNDDNIIKQINEIQNDSSILDSEKQNRINRLRNQMVLTEMECQRLIESKLEKANRRPFIKGCYFADSRGILFADFRTGSSPVLLIDRSSVRDQKWFDDLLVELQATAPGAFNENGEVIFSNAENVFFDDFLFDISDHVNMALYDNEKFGYERRFANFISKCSTYIPEKNGTGAGFPNLDFIKNQTPGRDDYDLSSAKFSSVPMQGSSNLFTCNVSFTYDFGFCTKGTIRADMIMRTPYFLDTLSTKSRIYVEKFQAQNPLRGDGGVWVGTRPAGNERYSVTTDPKNYYGCLVYPDLVNETTNFRVFEDGNLELEFQSLKNSDPQPTGHVLPLLDSSITGDLVKYGGYDGILGDQPGYFRGSEITKETALFAMNKIPMNTVKIDRLTYIKDEITGRININGISNRRIKKITIKYIPLSEDFLSNKERLISFVFPSSKTIVDNIGVPYQGKYSQKLMTICVNTRYISFDNWFIDGEILKLMDIKFIEAESIEEEEYKKYKVSTGVVSTCFDSKGNWLVFYEDEQGGVGDLSKNGKSADGSHLDNENAGKFPGLENNSNKEISCLFSSDRGGTWFDFKAVVRTCRGDSVSNPYVISDKIGGRVHLFYVMNNALMHKIIDSEGFEYQDAFLGYRRPNVLNENTDSSYGLYHFSSSGIAMRKSTSSVVVGDLNSSFLIKEASIVSKMKNNKRTDFRIIVSGDDKNYEEGFPDIDFIAYRDSAGQIKVLFVMNGKLYCRGSSDEGSSWYDFIDNGMFIHKNSLIQELKPVSFLGYVLDYNHQKVYLTYQSDGMLFVKSFESGSSITSASEISSVLDIDNGISKPVFVVGSVIPELKTALKNKESPVIFPYKDIDVFGPSFSISEIPSLGYSTANGFIRLFYKDASGNFRAFSYPETPILDITYGKAD